MQYRFVITGKIKPYVRMTRRGKWKSPEAQEYIASQGAIKTQLTNQMSLNDWKMLPAKTPLAVELSIGMIKVHTCDIDNCLKAVLDSANKVVFPDDCWIDKVNVWRYQSSQPKAELIVWVR